MKLLQKIIEALSGAAWIAACVLFRPLLRPWYSWWGATEAECAREMPGDERVPEPRIFYTRAVTINAPPQDIWSWLVQIGYGRAGWYSYDLLEALVGAAKFADGVFSADRIIPEYQTWEIGEPLVMHPKAPPLPAAVIDPPHALIFHSERDPKAADPLTENAWAFYLVPEGQKTRLIARGRLTYTPGFFNDLMWGAFTEPINFVMERKMLLGIKARADQRWDKKLRGQRREKEGV